jgi:hypothetical protein
VGSKSASECMSGMMASITTKDGTRADIFRAGVTLVVEGVVQGCMGLVPHLSLPLPLTRPLTTVLTGAKSTIL